MTLKPALLKATAVGGLAGLLFGFDTAVISGTTTGLTRAYGLTPGSLGLTVSIALWGTVAGALLSGIPGDRYGRRDTLRVLAALYLAGAIGCPFAWSWYALLFFRFVVGVAIGGSSVIGPMYIAEISPAKWRGRLVGVFQFNIVLGILVAYLSNYLIGQAGLGDAEWRWKFGVAALPAVLLLALLFSIPRSPRWLVEKGYAAEARAVLKLIGEPESGSRSQRHASRQGSGDPLRAGAPAGRSQPLSFIPRGFDCDVQSAFRDQRHTVLPERHLRRRRVQPGVGRFTGGGHRRNQPGFHGARHVDYRPGRTPHAFDHRGRRHGGLPGRRGIHIRHRAESTPAAVAADRLHRLLRVFARRGDLGIHQRGFSNRGAIARAEPGVFHALDHERADFLGVPDRGDFLAQPLRLRFSRP